MKLHDELQQFAAGVTDPAELERIEAAWTALLLSPVPDHSLRRYIRFQQQRLAALGEQPAARELLEFLAHYFGDYSGPAGPRLGLSLTVAQLALLIRLLNDEAVFVPATVAPLLRFFSAHFSSKRQPQMSPGSLNKLYYAGDQFTAAMVRDLLLRLLARLNHQFFHYENVHGAAFGRA